MTLWKKRTLKKRMSHKSKIKRVRGKKAFVVGDSIIKHIVGLGLRKRIISIVSVPSFPGTTINVILLLL